MYTVQVHICNHTHLIHSVICVRILHLDHNVGMDEMGSDDTRAESGILVLDGWRVGEGGEGGEGKGGRLK